MSRQWKLLRTENVHDDPWSVVLQKTYQIAEDPSEETYIVLKKPAFVLVVALDAANQLLLVQQYRHGTDQRYWALPGGFVDAGERPRESATRELQEETGFVARSTSYIAELHPLPGCVDTRAHIVLCQDLEYDAHTVLDDEIEASKFLPFDVVIAQIVSGELNELQSVAAILLAQEFMRSRKLAPIASL